MTKALARQGDTSTHGGTIAASSTKVKCNGKAVALEGDILTCPSHGPQPLIASSYLKVQGKRVICVGDKANCGAVVTTGSSNVFTGNNPKQVSIPGGSGLATSDGFTIGTAGS